MIQIPKSRPGGRSARVRATVADAVAQLLEEKGAGAVTMPDIAARAGVAATSLYRRWGDLPTLMLDVAVERLSKDFPLPDTGSLAGDLGTWAVSVAASLRKGSAFYRILVATAPDAASNPAGRITALGRRLEDIDKMLTRGRERGELAPNILDVTDHVLAPLYWRMLIGIPADEDVARGLVTRLLAVTAALGR